MRNFYNVIVTHFQGGAIMCREITLDTLCWYVLRQVPEADPAEVRRYCRACAIKPYDLSTVYLCARIVEKQLIDEGRI